MACQSISGLATGIWLDIGEPSALAVSSIYSRLTSSGYLGRLNSWTNSCYYISGDCIAPELGTEELAIYEQIYLVDYYNKLATQNQGAVGATVWTRIEEGDSKISRASPVEITKIYINLAKEAKDTLNDLVTRRNGNLSTPRSVDYYGIDQYGQSYPYDGFREGRY